MTLALGLVLVFSVTTKIQPPNISAEEPEVEPEFYMATIVYSQSIAESTL